MRFLSLIAVMLLLSAPARGEKPNIILVMCDDLGFGDVRCFNADSPIQTPSIDAMAADGLKFNRFYSAGPVCSPTRGSCLTGRHPYRYGIYHANVGHLKDEEITLPEILKDHGYTTGHFGKWHLGTLTTTVPDANRGGPTKKAKKHFAPPSKHGYDDSFVTESKVPTYDPMFQPENSGNSWDAMQDASSAEPYGTRYWDHAGNEVSDNLRGDDSRIIMDRAIPFIEKALSTEVPFFAAIWFHAPHLPVVAGPDHVEPYRQYDVYSRNYFGCITALDEQLGRLRARLSEWNATDNTMLWFCSDNGPEGAQGKAPGSSGGLRGRKRSLYEGGVRVPALLVWPGHAQPGATTDNLAVTSDYLPTILDVLQISYPDKRPLDGMSLLSTIHDPRAESRRGLGFQSHDQIAWHHDRHKLISVDRGKTWELYDLHSDRGEKNNLADGDPALVASLKADVMEWIQSCKASDAGKDYLIP